MTQEFNPFAVTIDTELINYVQKWQDYLLAERRLSSLTAKSYLFDLKEFIDFLNKYNVWINPGTLYGKEGEGYMRINLATSPELLEEGITKFINYYKENAK